MLPSHSQRNWPSSPAQDTPTDLQKVFSPSLHGHTACQDWAGHTCGGRQHVRALIPGVPIQLLNARIQASPARATCLRAAVQETALLALTQSAILLSVRVAAKSR